MLKPKVLEALNNQINAEIDSSYMYLAIAAWLDSKNFHGMARWMQVQAREEWKHAMKFFGHIGERAGRVTLQGISTPQSDWDSIAQAFEQVYKHECKVTARIDALMKLAIDEQDYATQSFLQWFVNEQVEEESSALSLNEKLKMMGDGHVGLFILDSELGKRADE